MTIEPVDYDFDNLGSLIKVIGIGGGGCNAVNHMVEQDNQTDTLDDEFTPNNDITINNEFIYPNFDDCFGKVEFYAVNTDAQALRKSKVKHTVQIGGALTRGLGAGSNPNVGRKAAEEDREALRQVLEGANMLFLTAGMGGGTGTGAIPVVAQIAKELGILTVAIVTKPFQFEGKRKIQFAEIGIKELSKYVDSLIVVPNDKLLKVLGKNVTLVEAFGKANDILRNAVTGISDMITSPGYINVDFEDVKAIMSNMGRAMMGAGSAKGKASEDRAEKAVQEAISSPLLEDVNLQGAKGILINVTAGHNLMMSEYDTIASLVTSYAADDATIKVGSVLKPELEDEIRVTLVVTGIGERSEPNIHLRSSESEMAQAGNSQNAISNTSATNTETKKDSLDTPAYERRRDFTQVNLDRFVGE